MDNKVDPFIIDPPESSKGTPEDGNDTIIEMTNNPYTYQHSQYQTSQYQPYTYPQTPYQPPQSIYPAQPSPIASAQAITPTQQSVTNTPVASPVSSVTTNSQSAGMDSSDFCILFNDSEPAMYIQFKKTGSTQSSETQFAFSQKNIYKSGNDVKISATRISSGCAQFVRYLVQNDDVVRNDICELSVTGIRCERIRVAASDISGKKSCVMEALANCGVCFTEKKYFNLWCVEVMRRINTATPIRVRSGYYKKDGQWHCVGIDSNDFSLSGQLEIITPFLDDLKKYDDAAFEELSVVLYGVISKMFAIFKEENMSPLANMIFVNSDTQKIADDLKRTFQLSDDDFYNDSARSLNTLVECKPNSTPIVMLSDKKAQNNSALDKISGYNSLKCFPLLVAGSFDNISKINSSRCYLIINVHISLSERTFRISEIFRQELLANKNLDLLISENFIYELNLLSELDLGLNAGVHNTYALMLAIIQTVLPKIGLSEIDELCSKFITHILNNNSTKTIDIDKLKYILTSDKDFQRVTKGSSSSLVENTLYYSEGSIYLNGETMSRIAEKFGYSNRNTFSDVLRSHELLDTNNGANLKVVNVGGKSVRSYSFNINRIFSFGDYIPSFQPHSGSVTHIKLGSLDHDRPVSFCVGDTDNNNMYISGGSGSGKTNFCNILAKQAANNGMGVVIIGKEYSIRDLCSDAPKYIINSPNCEIRWNELVKSNEIVKIVSYDDCESLLAGFFSFRRSIEHNDHVLLILDEAQEYVWEEGSTLRELLRQGRKFGISLILSTQYLSSGNGKAITNGLKQCSSFCLFSGAYVPGNILDRCPQKKNSVNSLNKYEALLVGNFSVDEVPIARPLLLKTDKS